MFELEYRSGIARLISSAREEREGTENTFIHIYVFPHNKTVKSAGEKRTRRSFWRISLLFFAQPIDKKSELQNTERW